ncbi:MAG: hypothetical protein QOJ54_684 [Aliidongia sp.]|jgi:hypothetical protein|nr:hypothetical protein [Aliidongia sp.]
MPDNRRLRQPVPLRVLPGRMTRGQQALAGGIDADSRKVKLMTFIDIVIMVLHVIIIILSLIR